MKDFLFAILIALFYLQAHAQSLPWQPTPGHVQTPLWPGKAPDAQPYTGPEFSTLRAPVSGKSWLAEEKVSVPTMTVYSPKGKNTGIAVMVFPGGGYWVLAMDLEGTEVCDWLTAEGITCVLVKYRVPGDRLYPRSGPWPESPVALEDAVRSIRLVRHQAAALNIDPQKIGVLGFSAGGHLVAALSTLFDRSLYKPVDEIDKESFRPDFAVALYPGHLWTDKDKFELTPNVPVSKKTPPTFILQAEDDHVDGINQALVYYIALQRAGVSTEMHLYAQGGHAFGLRPTKYPISHWPHLVDTWLKTIGIVSQ